MSNVNRTNCIVQTAGFVASTTANTVPQVTPPSSMPSDNAKVLVISWAQFTTGTGVTALAHRILRRVGANDIAVDNGVPEQVYGASQTKQNCCMAVQTLDKTDSAAYAAQFNQIAATGNGNVIQSGLLVFVF